jgi:BlaI family transcriptional regulator, penicillinase repressor
MPRPPRDIPPPLEMLCLKALWSLEEGNVKDVREVVAQSRPLAYTTIMTVLERLVRKGRLVRRKVGRAFVYSPQASRDTMRRAAIRELVDGFFDGSEEELVRFLSASETQVAAAAAGGHSSSTRAEQAKTPAEEAPIDTVLL